MDQAVVPVGDVPLRLEYAGGPGDRSAVEITREGFEWALRNACLPSYVRGVHPDRARQRELKRAPPRVQWDPERDLRLRPLPVPVAATRPLR